VISEATGCFVSSVVITETRANTQFVSSIPSDCRELAEIMCCPYVLCYMYTGR
jgi:hypothetical protein